ncbi:hypothetical protein GWK08_14370 [Leptobacterium flavescens]|uniref:SdiA-regulated family protein n=1 Tax=Leptobacterium flavescens TaxID=472055 RepID=A0A6P0UNU0_9FLAO|nr:SdiA-regulated domain-containing protein [Leptobacterium flavescens]NER14637.1 hypothetical protein [Leptobacterium flavescens]
MKKIFVLIGLLLFSCSDYGQLSYVLKIPNKLSENSGIEYSEAKGLLWVIEDSGNKDHIYALDKKGKIVRNINIKKAKNSDWEDLSRDNKGNFYIGDIGNNYNMRKDLTIYKIPDPDKTPDAEELEAEKITFEYPEQTRFPPKKSERIYDAEAFFYYREHLYIFTKNRSTPFTGKTYLYRIPAKKGHHKAELIASHFMCGEYLNCAITAAAISPDMKKVVLLSHDKVWVFSDFTTDNFFEGKKREIALNHYSQKEGICFKDNDTLLISDEDNVVVGRNLYMLKLD